MSQSGSLKNQLTHNQQSLFDDYYTVAQTCASKYTRNPNYDDILQEAFLGLLSAIKSYTDAHDCSFKTFAFICINNKIRSYLYKTKKFPTSISDNITYLDLEKISFILPDSLNDIDREIIYFRLSNYTFKEIADYYNININTLHYKYKNIIKKIRMSNV